MTDPPQAALDQNLRTFIEDAFPSVWALETLLLIKGRGDRDWTTEALVQEMRASTNLIADCLKSLERAGLITTTPQGVRYRPASASLSALVDQLSAVYAERPFSVTGVITGRRADALKGFADSFRLGRWKS